MSLYDGADDTGKHRLGHIPCSDLDQAEGKALYWQVSMLLMAQMAAVRLRVNLASGCTLSKTFQEGPAVVPVLWNDLLKLVLTINIWYGF